MLEPETHVILPGVIILMFAGKNTTNDVLTKLVSIDSNQNH